MLAGTLSRADSISHLKRRLKLLTGLLAWPALQHCPNADWHLFKIDTQYYPNEISP